MIPFLALIPMLAFTTLAAEKKAAGGFQYSQTLDGAEACVYKTAGDVKLNLHIFKPKDLKATDRRPAIVFFFGGGWSNGSPMQFANHCKYLAAHGMVAITADYRVWTRQQAKVVQCVADAKSAMRWVRAHAAEWGIDPDRIAAGGGSAGGHLAACSGTITGFDEPGESTSVSAQPNAMVLFNPAIALAAIEGTDFKGFEKMLADRLGTDAVNISPAHQVKPGIAPTIIFHGESDTSVAFSSVKAFDDSMKKAGNRCELVGYPGEGHGFFNYRNGGGKNFFDTLEKTHRFLASLGWIKGEPNVKEFFAEQGK
jgi:acetyl esterase/lipase